MPFHVVAEGHGEPAALENLLNRLQQDLGLPSAVWRRPRRMSVLTHAKAERVAELVAGARYDGDYESPRDAKGELTALMPLGRSYKPTTDQLAFTRMLDFARLRASGLPCFGTLERALRFLLGGATPGSVFPIDH